jgi:hypothetical protein
VDAGEEPVTASAEEANVGTEVEDDNDDDFDDEIAGETV